jgi:glutathione S-transferase
MLPAGSFNHEDKWKSIMKLYYSANSPFVRKVTILAMEAGIDGKIQHAPASVLGPGSEVAKDNPLGKVPCLITDDGQALYDSPVICEYLDGQLGGGKAFPPAGPARWTALRRQALADGIMDAAVGRVMEGRRPENERSPAAQEKNRKVIAGALDFLEAEADKLGDPKGAADIGLIAVGCALGYMDLRHGADNWRQGRPKLTKWFEVFSQRPSMSATVPPG